MIYWEQRKVNDIAETRRGLTYKPNDICEDGIRVLRSSNINEDTFVKREDDVFVDRKAINIPFVQNGDILITSANGSSRLVGKHAIICKITDNSAVHGGFMLLATAKNPQFLNASMGASWYIKFINLFVAGGNGAIGNLNKNDLDEQTILVPCENEQEIIGRFFENLDHLITLHQSKSFGHILKAIVSCTLYWEQRKLGEIVDVCNGRDYKHLLEGDIPVYGTGGYMISVNKALSYDRDAIGIGRKGTIDKPYILNAPFWTVDTLFYVIPRDKIALIFAFCIFQNIEWEKKDESTGVPSLSKAAINEIDVLIPKYEEQQVLGIFFNGLDHLITLHQLEPFQLIFKAIAYRIIDYAKSKPPRHTKYEIIISFIK